MFSCSGSFYFYVNAYTHSTAISTWSSRSSVAIKILVDIHGKCCMLVNQCLSRHLRLFDFVGWSEPISHLIHCDKTITIPLYSLIQFGFVWLLQTFSCMFEAYTHDSGYSKVTCRVHHWRFTTHTKTQKETFAS